MEPEPDEQAHHPFSAVKAILITPLYRDIPYDLADKGDVMRLERMMWGSVQYDAYCPECRLQATFRTFREEGEENPLPQHFFRSAANLNRAKHLILHNDLFAVHTACTRSSHLQSFIFQNRRTGTGIENGTGIITKIGQVPSYEDIAGAELEQYRKLLGPYSAEMKKAGGLFSHGISIGAFVYLRRVFEKVIDDHRATYEAMHGPIADYQKMRMEDRIVSLSSTLPALMVKNTSVYKILSKGVHELSEAECGMYFPVVRAALITILEEDRDRAEKARAAGDLEQELSRISTQLASAKS